MRIFLILLLTFSFSAFAANDKNADPEKAAKKEMQGEMYQHGKPDNPGSQGKANAAMKQGTDPGKGTGKEAGQGVGTTTEGGNKSQAKKKNKKGKQNP